MKFPAPLIEGTLIRRYMRFLADVKLASGETVTAHCANPGSMLSVREPGARVWLSPAAKPDRKLRYTWELIEANGALVGINTAHPNALVAEAIAAGRIPELGGYAALKREQRYGRNSRIDILLESPDRPACYVEVKNVTMRRDPEGPAEFPDSVTARGAKHLDELAAVVRAGGRAAMVFLVQRGDCRRFTVAADIDPGYAKALKSAVKAGVEALCYGAEVTPAEIVVTAPLTLDLPR
jgi:sugar fermentation stimulation protein A